MRVQSHHPLNVVITDSNFQSNEPERNVLEKAGLRVTQFHCRTVEELKEAGKDADAALVQFAPVTGEVLKAWDRCQIIVRYGIGYDNVDIRAAEELGIQVCNVPSYCLDEVADHTCTLILASLRKIVPFHESVKRGEWDVEKIARPMKSFADTTIGLLGFGRIGRNVCRRLVPFGFRLMVYDPYMKPGAEDEFGAVRAESLRTILGESDVVTLHLPLSQETRHLIDEATLRLMKPGAVLVNTSRGGLVDTVALARALREYAIGFAALDVFEEEPLPPDHPLRACGNVLFTPHAAFYSDVSLLRLQQQAAEEIVRWFSGEPLSSPVNRPRKPRR